MSQVHVKCVIYALLLYLIFCWLLLVTYILVRFVLLRLVTKSLPWFMLAHANSLGRVNPALHPTTSVTARSPAAPQLCVSHMHVGKSKISSRVKVELTTGGGGGE